MVGAFDALAYKGVDCLVAGASHQGRFRGRDGMERVLREDFAGQA